MAHRRSTAPSAARPPKVSFAGVNKFYGSSRAQGATTLALQDFDLDIAPEEIVSIVGPTGCGKSTSLNLRSSRELVPQVIQFSDSIEPGAEVVAS